MRDLSPSIARAASFSIALGRVEDRPRWRGMSKKRRSSGLDKALGRKPPVPQFLRPLTPREAAARGVSLTAKRRVDASVKRVTKRTWLYTDREVASARLRRKTGKPEATRETYARERKAHAPTEKLIIVQPGGTFVDVTVQGSDITKIRARNEAIAAARSKGGEPGNLRPPNRFMRRYRRYYVKDAETGERVNLIMSRDDLDRSKAQMNTATRDEIDKRYAEDMAET